MKRAVIGFGSGQTHLQVVASTNDLSVGTAPAPLYRVQNLPGHSLLMADEIPVGILSGACFYAVAGGYWLWADLARPYASQEREKEEPRR